MIRFRGAVSLAVVLMASVSLIAVAYGQAEASPEATQSDLSRAACQELKREVDALQAVLAKARAKFRGNRHALTLLEASQSAWANYRDAQLELHDPNKVYGSEGSGSVVPMCLCIFASVMTHDRAQELRQYLDPGVGDVCNVP